ncbi:MFS transporter [Martelella endophytica]|uniref:MFS transporter n=1 Tax=Martelella endophytica TaxID=1486262 RepID=UPI0005F1F03E|nr:MFS transporter [Martelella endophytica]
MSAAAPNFLNQPKAVWATAFACVVGFMSIGLVDPILTSIAKGLDASPSDVSMLFTSYFFVTSVMMLVTGFVSSRIGGPKTLLLGAALIVVFSALAGLSTSVGELVLFRAGWGLGNAFFVVTALSVIVASSRGGMGAAILMYEAALGLGISVGPLLGALLGGMSWRYPFFGTATLMAIGFIAIFFLLPPMPKPEKKIAISAPIRALGHGGLRTAAIAAFFYNYGFFTVLAFVPFVLDMSAHAIGLIFFGWGLLLALFSVLIAPRLQARFSTVQILAGSMLILAVLLLVMAFGSIPVIAACVIISGALMGVCNTVFTELALGVSDSPRPVASAGYNFVRWFAGVIAPFAAPHLAESFGTASAFYVAVVAALASALVLYMRRDTLKEKDETETAAAPVGVVLSLAGDAHDQAVIARAAKLGRDENLTVHVLHVRTFEVIDGNAAAVEDKASAEALLAEAIAALKARDVTADGELIEAAAAHLAPAIDTRLKVLRPRYVVIGHGAGGDLSHGSTVRSLVHGMPAGPELVLV